MTGAGTVSLPVLAIGGTGDSSSFTTHGPVTVEVTATQQPDCRLAMYSTQEGRVLDDKTVSGKGSVTLDPGDSSAAYISELNCTVKISEAK